MSKCACCHSQKGKRSCPALGGSVCSLCCGTHRGREIRCPTDCCYFGPSLKDLPTSESYSRAIDKLLRFRETKATWVKTAIQTFLGEEREPEKWEHNPCVDYCLHGHRDQNGHRLVDLFLAERGAELREDERASLALLDDAWFSFFEVQAVKLNEGLELQDLVSGQSVFIRERLGTKSIKKFDLLLAPVITFGDRHEMTGGSALVPRVHREAVLKALHEGADAWKQKRPESSLREQLRGSLLPAFQALREAYANVLLPEIRNSDGDEIVYSTATYEVLDEAGLYERLDAHPAFKQTAEDEEETIYNWSGESENASFGNGLVDLGTIRIRKGTLALETNSRERLEEGKELLAEVLDEVVRHQDDEFKDLETAIAENKARKESGEADETDADDEIPSEIKAEILGNLYRDHLKRWVDERIPALGGETPRAAVKTAAGRRKVLEMLKDQENMLARNRDGAEVDFTEVYRALGLERRAE